MTKHLFILLVSLFPIAALPAYAPLHAAGIGVAVGTCLDWVWEWWQARKRRKRFSQDELRRLHDAVFPAASLEDKAASDPEWSRHWFRRGDNE